MHPDIAFQNIVYDPTTLKARLIDIEPVKAWIIHEKIYGWPWIGSD